MTLSLQLFGAPAVFFDGQSAPLAFERRGQLAAYLALKRTWVARSELASLLWPGQDGKLAHTNLRKALHRLQSLPWAARVEARTDALRLVADSDVAAFEQAVGEGRNADALRCRRGELLAGFDEHDNEAWTAWLGFERDRLRAAWRRAAQQMLADAQPAAGAELATRLLDDDPFDEQALIALVSCLAKGGQAARARQAYREFTLRLERELGVAAGAELRALHETLLAPGPALAAPDSVPPSADEGFVGRVSELRRVSSLLAQDDCRLLTVFGPGGAGKTRLARHVLRDPGPAFADGAIFVPLEDLASAGGLPERLARDLAIPLEARAEPLQQVIKALRGRRMLLVLDNFEHLADGAPLLETLLAACPRLKVLVTSRVRLALASEWLLPLEGLPCPEDDDLDRIESFDAARLFVQAARRVRPDLAPAAEAAAICDICRQVDGLPLALELAASWTRVLSCADIAAELRRSTELLRAADPAQPPRHASFEAVFEQSWQMLGDAERQALARLAVFSGSFSADAARAVAGAALPVLGALADKSLLRRDAQRLSLHPLVQQLAAARLADGPSEAEARAAHAAYFQLMLAQLKPAVENGERRALRALDEEFENCRRALLWSIEHGDRDAIARSVGTLEHYLQYRGRIELGLDLVGRAVASAAVGADPVLHARLLAKLAQLQYRLDRYAQAATTASLALERARRSRDVAARLQALNVLGTCALRTGRLEAAKRHFTPVLELVEREGDARNVAVTCDHLALVEKAQGRYAEARRLMLRSLIELRRLGDGAGEALCLNNLASVEVLMNEDVAAAAHLHEARAICERDGHAGTIVLVLANLADLALRCGDLAAARFHGEGALEAAEKVGNRMVAAWTRIRMATLALREGHADTARVGLASAAATALELGAPMLKFDALACFAEILAAQGAADCAAAVLDWAAAHPAATPADRERIRARRATLAGAVPGGPAWPALELDQLLHRIGTEADLTYAPLVAELRGGPPAERGAVGVASRNARRAASRQ